MTKINKDEFFKKVNFEGNFEGVFEYHFVDGVTDDVDLNAAWLAFKAALQDLMDIRDDWVDPDEEALFDDWGEDDNWGDEDYDTLWKEEDA